MSLSSPSPSVRAKPDPSQPTLRLAARRDTVTLPDGVQPLPFDRAGEGPLPARIGRFAIESKLGSGGMGVVYAAHDKQLGRKIAIKLLRAAPSADFPEDSEADPEKLLREAQNLALLDHPNVVAVHEVGVLDGEVFVAMEFIEGKTLRQWLRTGPRSQKEILDAFAQAGRGLAAAHRAGLVHRDFKPDNAMIDVHGRVRVLDFGLARAAGTGAPSSLIARIIDSGAGRIASSSVAGTPAYMAPEQHLGLPCDARSDQFSFCVALYEALCGVRPFPDGDPTRRFQAILATELRRPARKLPGWLRAAIARGLAPVPARRFPSMDALLAALTEAPRRRRRIYAAAAMLGLVSVAGGLGYGLYVERRADCATGEDRVAELWSDRREGLQAAILASGANYAEDTWRRLDSVMVARGEAWRGMFRATCEAHQRGEQSERQLEERMACLQRQRVEVDALLTALSEQTGDVVRHALRGAGQLDPVAMCADVEALRAMARPAPDPLLALRGEGVRAALSRAKQEGELGRYQVGLAGAEAALAAARQLGDPGLVAEGLLRVGNLRKSLANYAQAESELEDAHYTAIAAGNDRLAAEAASSLLVTVGYHLGDPARARQWDRAAAALLARQPGNPRIEAAYYNNRGIVRASAGEYAAAAADYARALALYTDERAGDDPRVALVLGNMSRVDYMRGDLQAATEHLERSLAIRERAFGPDHPEVAITLSNLAIVLTDRGELDRAVELLRRGLVIEEMVYGSSSPKLAPTLDNLAGALTRRGAFGEALPLFHRALHLLEAGPRPDELAIAEVLISLGGAYVLQRRVEDGLPALRRALALRLRLRGAEHPDTAHARLELGEALLQSGALDEAESLIRGGLSTLERSFGATHPQSAAARALLGRSLLRRGADELARELLERALKPLEELGTPLTRGRTRAALAKALARGDAQDRERARSLAALAAVDLTTAGAGFAGEREELRAWAGRDLSG